MKLSITTLSLLLTCLIQWVSAELVYFSIVLTWERREVAGFERDVILINNSFPGPELRLVQGDEVIFDVKNDCPFNVTVHFHGKFILSDAKQQCRCLSDPCLQESNR